MASLRGMPEDGGNRPDRQERTFLPGRGGSADWAVDQQARSQDQIGACAGAAFVFGNVGSFAATVGVAARVLAGLALIATIAAIWRAPEPAGDVAHGGHALLIVAAFEAVALTGGLKLLNGNLDSPGAEAAWIATVVGLHFFVLARLWEISAVNWLAAAATGCGLVGCVLAFARAGGTGVRRWCRRRAHRRGAARLLWGTRQAPLGWSPPCLQTCGAKDGPGCLTVAVTDGAGCLHVHSGEPGTDRGAAMVRKWPLATTKCR